MHARRSRLVLAFRREVSQQVGHLDRDPLQTRVLDEPAEAVSALVAVDAIDKPVRPDHDGWFELDPPEARNAVARVLGRLLVPVGRAGALADHLDRKDYVRGGREVAL